MGEPLGNIYYPKQQIIVRQSGRPIYTNRPKMIIREEKTPLRIVTINLPCAILEQIEDFKKILYASRSEAIRVYVMAGVQRDLELIRLLEGDFEERRDLFPENATQFSDRWGVTWNIGRAVENV